MKIKSKRYKELENIYTDWNYFLKKVEVATHILDVGTFSSLIGKLEIWQQNNNIPKYKKIETNYGGLLKCLNYDSGITLSVSMDKENGALKLIKDDSKIILQKIGDLLDYFSDKINQEIKFKLFERDKKGIMSYGNNEVCLGKIYTRSYKLLKSLFNPLGSAKTIETVLVDIQIAKDRKNLKLMDSYLSRAEKMNILISARREVYRKLKLLESKERIKINIEKNKVWASIEK
ncbi:MAG: hypothetical protein WC516_03035 [Patescibacteria group bacterium]